jgi:hypothetical protein
MSDALNILKLIEAVDPANEPAMEEIDLAVWKYLGGGANYESRIDGCPDYTTSRDVLKGIRPHGFFSVNENGSKGWQAWINRPDDEGGGPCFLITGMPTECLAELYCIIQAIEHDRITGR